MKKIFSIIVTVMGLAALFAVGAFAAEAGSDVGVNNAIATLIAEKIDLFVKYCDKIAEPILQVVVWVLDELWGMLQELVSGLL